ncbi:hypothetical protein Ade02nite_19700 [Paractinoplanes deccanensis]|uniref:Pectate lyase superfamily protein domain-containing protein n=1 Tax=Paractinoplanes deccanensis TaxID=113561 RepID=A0ABQ3Y002_9ACTN|nr:hypothetical protein [Actinoplanes deccanensis]GID73329.1 hypothetical protein Ade02nite_19700 [Actinoplanes deccanensis]
MATKRLPTLDGGDRILSQFLPESVATVAVPPPVGNVAADTATVQDALDAAATGGAGRVVLSAGWDYEIAGVTIDTGVVLDLNGGGLTLADNTDAYLLSTVNYDTLAAGDTTGGARDWAVINGYLDGNKAAQSGTKPVFAIYGRRYILNRLLIRNGKGHGLATKWSTTSPFLSPNGFESFITDVYIHSCDGDGLRFEGPHDTYVQNLFVVKCSATASAVPVNLPDATGRANGSNFDKFHVYGGNGYNYGLVVNTSGTKFTNFVVEGSQVAQCLIQASQVQFDAAHLYPGGIATATVKGIQVGDSTHTALNGLWINAKVENCGGGGFDFTYMGDHNWVRAHIYYYTGTTPTLATAGFVGTPTNLNSIQLYVADNTFVPTTQCLNAIVGPSKILRTAAADTRDLVDVRDQAGTAMYTVDYKGRPRSKAGATPTVANGAQIGTGGSPGTAISGTDHAGMVTVTTGSSGAAAGQLAAVTFSTAFGATPRAVVITPKDAGGAALQPFVTTAASGFSIRCAGVPVASTTYTFDYIVIGS